MLVVCLLDHEDGLKFARRCHPEGKTLDYVLFYSSANKC